MEEKLITCACNAKFTEERYKKHLHYCAAAAEVLFFAFPPISKVELHSLCRMRSLHPKQLSVAFIIIIFTTDAVIAYVCSPKSASFAVYLQQEIRLSHVSGTLLSLSLFPSPQYIVSVCDFLQVQGSFSPSLPFASALRSSPSFVVLLVMPTGSLSLSLFVCLSIAPPLTRNRNNQKPTLSLSRPLPFFLPYLHPRYLPLLLPRTSFVNIMESRSTHPIPSSGRSARRTKED